MGLIDRVAGVGGQNALFFVVVLVVSLLGGVGPAILSALISACCSTISSPPRSTASPRPTDNFITTVVLLVVAVAVAILVDAAAKLSREARRASQEAELLALFAGSVLRGADLPALLEKVRETYSQTGVSVVRRGEGVVSAAGVSAPSTVDEAGTVCEVSDGEYALLLAGEELGARDRKVPVAVANQAVGLIRQRQSPRRPARRSPREADRLRRSLLSAVSHDLAPHSPRSRQRCRACAATTVEFSPRTPRNCSPPWRSRRTS